jgi:hypothetical protein
MMLPLSFSRGAAEFTVKKAALRLVWITCSEAIRLPRPGLVPRSRLFTSNLTVTASAFVGTNPTGELITSGLPFISGQYFNLFFKRGFSEKCYCFPVGFLFHEEGSPLPAKIF